MQTRRQSAIEVTANVTVGYLMGFGLNLLVLPAFGWDIAPGQAAWVSGIYTGMSLVRGYAMRRAFAVGWRRLRGC